MRRVVQLFAGPVLRQLARWRRGSVPERGFTAHRLEIPFVDGLTDANLRALNGLLEWKSFVVDRHGRRFGNVAWTGKRQEPQVIPDPRIIRLDDELALTDKSVLEIGCFEGNHTVALCQRAARVTAVDARMINVVKTIVRCAMFDVRPTVFPCDVEARPLPFASLAADVVHHVGVFYHLADPVRHLLDLGQIARRGLMLDTHYARDGDATESYAVDGVTYRYKRYLEFGVADPFSGMQTHSKWLRLDDILALLRRIGLGDVRVMETRSERNGPRVLLIAARSTDAA